MSSTISPQPVRCELHRLAPRRICCASPMACSSISAELGVAAEPAEIVSGRAVPIGDGGALAAYGTVSLVVYLGGEAFLHVAMPRGDILAVEPAAEGARVGEWCVRRLARGRWCSTPLEKLPLFGGAQAWTVWVVAVGFVLCGNVTAPLNYNAGTACVTACLPSQRPRRLKPRSSMVRA